MTHQTPADMAAQAVDTRMNHDRRCHTCRMATSPLGVKYRRCPTGIALVNAVLATQN